VKREEKLIYLSIIPSSIKFTEMSTALVSAFYDFNDVIQQQSKQRPAMLDLRQRPLEQRKPSNLLISRRHSTNSTNLNSLASPSFTKTNPLSPSSSSFFPMPSSPKDPFLNGCGSTLASALNMRERAQSASFQEELDAQHRKRSGTNSSRYKTELCRPFEENGTCKYGDKCQFAHGYHELRGLNRHPKYKTEFCRTYHTIGFCPYGPRCHFIHNDEEKRLAQASTGRSVSMSSMDSAPSSPVIDFAPSPFSNTPPTSPGVGDVFVFDEPTAQQNLPPMKSSLASMSTIPEMSSHQFVPNHITRSISVSSALPSKTPSPPNLTISSLITEGTRIESRPNTFQPIQMKLDERNILTPSDSGSSNPPSPTDSLDGSNRRRLPVFGLMKQ